MNAGPGYPPGAFTIRMKKLFYSGLAGLALFEFLRVYFIMPLPGSQRMDSLEVAYFLHTWRWAFRIGFLLLIAAGVVAAFRIRWKWLPALAVLVVGAVVWLGNFQMSAEHMFRQPETLVFKSLAECGLDDKAVVIGVEHNGEARAYPVRYLTYHHQVQDTVGGKSVLVTYCSVCRTGRVFAPVVRGQAEKFRLVGMDHFNAMLEDSSTGSWWRQATGEAVAGPLKGTQLPDAAFTQQTLGTWAALHPAGAVMLPDEAARDGYDTEGKFERGESEGSLTKTDRASWEDKSWVVGVEAGGATKAYDWNRLTELHVINDAVGGTPIVLALASDGQSFVAFERPAATDVFTLSGEVLSAGGLSWDFAGRELDAPDRRLKPVRASQEFWHSWRTFHPDTAKY